jgi:hypothetical protein
LPQYLQCTKDGKGGKKNRGMGLGAGIWGLEAGEETKFGLGGGGVVGKGRRNKGAAGVDGRFGLGPTLIARWNWGCDAGVALRSRLCVLNVSLILTTRTLSGKKSFSARGMLKIALHRCAQF